MKQASDLAEAMKTAATSYSTRDLLSVRYMNHFNTLFGFLRVIFLSLIGLLIGGLLSLPYMDHASIPLIVSSSAADSLLGSVLLESGVQCLSEYFMVSPVDSVFRYAGISASQKTNLGSRKHNRSMDAEK